MFSNIMAADAVHGWHEINEVAGNEKPIPSAGFLSPDNKATTRHRENFLRALAKTRCRLPAGRTNLETPHAQRPTPRAFPIVEQASRL